jgi:ATP-dependent Zn protease
VFEFTSFQFDASIELFGSFSEASVTKSELLSNIQVTMAGRAAEETIYGEGEVDGGAANDFEKATDLAYHMVTKYGASFVALKRTSFWFVLSC